MPDALPGAAAGAGVRRDQGGYVGVTNKTARLLEYWTNPDRDQKLFFCQIEALETAIYITEVAKKYGDVWIENDLRNRGGEGEARHQGRLPSLRTPVLPARFLTLYEREMTTTDGRQTIQLLGERKQG